VSGGFSTDCASCHTTNPGWRPATFNHILPTHRGTYDHQLYGLP
jgi:hypothetical protein